MKPISFPKLTLCGPGLRVARRSASHSSTTIWSRCFSPRVLSTTLTVAWVAAGRRADYLSDGHFVGNLHFAAGIAICRAAGCVVTDLAGTNLEKGCGLIVAADGATHEQLVSIIAPHLASVLS